jgi:predicted nucleic acid-binding protein
VTSAIIDTTTLVYLTRLHETHSFLDKLKSLLETLYIPLEVKNEYAKGVGKEPNRNWLLKRLDAQQGFFRLCTSYDSVTMNIVTGYKGIDKGEAESYAQQKEINARIIITDDKDFTSAVKSLDPAVTLYTTLHVICSLDIQGYLADWKTTIEKIHAIRPFSSSDLRCAYDFVLRELGLFKTKKEISNKCSLKRLIGTKGDRK